MFDVSSQWMDVRLGCGTVAEKVDVFETEGSVLLKRMMGGSFCQFQPSGLSAPAQLLTVSFCLLLITSDGVLIVISLVWIGDLKRMLV